MKTDFKLIADLAAQITEIPKDSIISQTVQDTDAFKAVLFGFDTGQELSEHTSTFPALIYVSSGAFEVGLGDERHSVNAGAWISMQPNLKHSLTAKEPSTMLLILVKHE
jgi:quercetin dioxygenase-like cupin family protein